MRPNCHSEESPSLTTQSIQKLLYGRKTAAWALSVSIRTIDYALAAGEFETRRIGRKTLITAGSLKRYAAANHFGPIASSEPVGVIA
jgi:hypothetical protein